MWASAEPREIVEQMFLAISLVLGMPSAIIFLFSASGSIQLYFLTPAKSTPSSPTGNGIVDGLVAGASVVGKAFSLANAAAEWVTWILTVVSLFLTVAAAILFTIARGLHAGRIWARILGILVTLMSLMISILILTSVRRPVPMALGASGALLAAYTIWVLAWRFP